MIFMITHFLQDLQVTTFQSLIKQMVSIIKYKESIDKVNSREYEYT